MAGQRKQEEAGTGTGPPWVSRARVRAMAVTLREAGVRWRVLTETSLLRIFTPTAAVRMHSTGRSGAESSGRTLSSSR